MRAVVGLIATLCASVVWADVVKVRVSSRSIATDEELQVTFTFSGKGDAQLPDLKADWNVAGQQSGRSFQWVNGRTSEEVTQTYVLTPKRAGELTIGPARIISGGQASASSEPVTITVRAAAAQKPSEAQKAPLQGESANQQLLLVAEFERDVYYAGEPFVAAFVLYVQQGVQLRRLPEQGEIALPDSVQREDVLGGKVEEEGTTTRNGRAYVRVPLFREVWKVLEAGTFTVPSYKVAIPVPSRSLFDDQQRLRLKTAPLTLEVKPVPTAGRPSGYREGAIGQFEAKASLQADEEHARAVLTVEVSGSGAVDVLDAPELGNVTGARVKLLPDDKRGTTQATKDGLKGKRTFQYLITPERTGTVFVPAVEVPYFDPKAGAFRSAKTEPVNWTAKVASPPAAAVPAAPPSTKAPAVDAKPVEVFHSIVTEADFDAAPRRPFHRTLWFPLSVGLPVLAWLGLVVVTVVRRRRSSLSGKARVRGAASRAAARLDEAARLGARGEAVELYAAIAKALRTYVDERFGLATLGLVGDVIRQELTARGVREAAAAALIQELEACDFARFARSAADPSELAAAIARARQVIEGLEGRHA